MPRNKAHPHVHGKKQVHVESERNDLSNRGPAPPSRNRTLESLAVRRPLAKTVIVNANSVVVNVQIMLERPRMRARQRNVKTARERELIQSLKGQFRRQRERNNAEKARSSKLKRLLGILESSGPTALNLIEVILRFLGLGK